MISSSMYAMYSSADAVENTDLTTAFTPIDAPKPKALKYPFSFLGDCGWNVEDITTGILEEESCDAGNFPHNITEYYYVQKGWNDGDAWECLCKLDTGCYAFYTASCDYTGFDCQGGMELIVSMSQENLFYKGITEEQRRRILMVKSDDSDSDSDSDSVSDSEGEYDYDAKPYGRK